MKSTAERRKSNEKLQHNCFVLLKEEGRKKKKRLISQIYAYVEYQLCERKAEEDKMNKTRDNERKDLKFE